MNQWQPLSAYIPFDRQAAIIGKYTLPVSSAGTVLFADIAGYTPLSRLYADRLGLDRGAEALTQKLNQFDTVLITELHRYKGSVLFFSGDSITCWIEGDLGERALMIAMNMQKAFAKIKHVEVSPEDSIEVGLKVAIAHGTVQRFLVGNSDIQKVDAIAGHVLDRAAAAEQMATAGEIIVDEKVQAHLKGGIEVADYRLHSSGETFATVKGTSINLPEDPWPEFAHEAAETLEEWVLPPIVTHLASEDGDFLTELRDSCALFLSFSGIDYDHDPAAGEKLDQFIQLMQGVLVRYDAYILQLTIGEKGSYLLASVGAPIAHEDNSSRAVSAALEIMGAVKKMGDIESVQIGINQGIIRAGTYGAPNRKTYGVQGSAINFAARLMQQAEDYQIVVSDSVVAQALGFEFLPLPLASFKGFEGDIQTYAVIGKKNVLASRFSGRENRIEVVGRESELDQIFKHLSSRPHQDKEDEKDEKGSTLSAPIVIEGEAGMGKSVLLSTTLSQLESMGIRFWLGAADAIERTTPYFAWRPIIQTIFGINDEMSSKDIKLAVTSIINGGGGSGGEETSFLLDRAPLLEDILPIQWGDNLLTSSLSGTARAENIRDFIFGTLELAMAQAESAGERPILVIEDAHWLDSPSVDILSRIRRVIPSLVLIILTRPIWDTTAEESVTTTFLQSLKEESGTIFLQLDSLPPATIDGMIANKLGVARLPRKVRTLIHSRAEGNPFYSEEIAYALRDLGMISIQDGKIHLPKGVNFESLRFPNTIQGVITSRIDRLSPSEQLTAKTASVIGRLFEVDALTRIHPAFPKKQMVISHMGRMTDLDLTLIEKASFELAYMFRHVMTQEVAYSLLPFEQRKSLHKRLAETIETSGADVGQIAPLLTHHWKRAENVVKTGNYLLLAGKQATRNGSFREADKALTELLEMEADGRITNVTDLEKAEWQWLLGQARYGLGRLDEARDLFESAVAILDQPVPKSGFKLAMSILRNAGVQTLHRRNPDRYFGVATDEQRYRYNIAMQIYRSLNDIYFYMEEKIRLLYVGVRQINVAENVGLSPWLPQANAVMGVITSLFGMDKLSDAYFERAMEAASMVDDPTALGTVLLGNSLIRVGKGDFSGVYENGKQALEIFDRFGRRKDWGDTMSTIAFSNFFQGHYRQATQKLTKLFDSSLQTGHAIHEIQAQTWLGAIAYREGDYQGAIRLLDKSIPLFERAQDKVSEISFRGTRGLAYFQLGEEQKAAEEIQKAADLIGSTNGQPSGYYSREGYTAVCEYALNQLEQGQLSGQKHALQSRVEKALKAMKAYSGFFVLGKPALDFYTGWYLEIQGESSKSIEVYKKGLDEAIRLSLTYEIMQITQRLIPLLPEQDPARATISAHAKNAQQIMSSL